LGDSVDGSIFRDLNFKTTLSESEFEDFVDFAMTFFGREVEFSNLILSSDSEVHVSLCNESRNVRCGEKNEGESMVSDQSDVEPIVAMELYIYQMGISTRSRRERGYSPAPRRRSRHG